MSTHLKYIVCFFAFTLFFLSCRKDSVVMDESQLELPPISTTGTNTFGCRVNGEIWIPEVPFSFSGPIPLNASMGNGGISIQATKKVIENNTVVIYQTIGIGVHSNLKDSMDLNSPYDSTVTMSPYDMEGASAGYGDAISMCSYTTDSILHPGFIKFLRIDSTERIISGIFEYTVIENGCDTVRITDGRFDIKL